uniref:Uncharacterized protein n=1 Tax=Spongospora subterranea TaxID=70186 RepID=A0A0H5QVW8_9EUKA|eukprot:CRZ05751.1 hypothetical protein [Spongospora subterranea]
MGGSRGIPFPAGVYRVMVTEILAPSPLPATPPLTMWFTGSKPSWTFATDPNSSISAVEACPFPDAADHVAVAGDSRLTIIRPDWDPAMTATSVINHPHEYISSVAWHQESITGNLTLGVANPNRSVSVYRIVEGRSPASRDFSIHTDSINSLTFLESSLITTSDDATIRQTEIEDRSVDVVLRRLHSRGIVVRSSNSIILAGELNGTLHLLDRRASPPTSPSVITAPAPLIDADFMFPLIATISDSKISLFDVRKTSTTLSSTTTATIPQRVRIPPTSINEISTAHGYRVVMWDRTLMSEESARYHEQQLGCTGMSWHALDFRCFTGADHVIYGWDI